jgi:streptogramin lyase
MRFAAALRCGLLVAVVAAVLAQPALGDAPVGLIKEIPLHGNAGGIAAGPEGNLWLTQNLPVRGGLAIGRITPAGKVTRFKQGLTTATQPLEITAGPDGNLWFTYDPGISSMSGGIGRITPAGQITLFPEPPELHGVPFEIVAGPDGNLWFTHAAIFTPTGQAIGRITPSGEITEFFAGLSEKADVAQLTPGPGGIWFADESSAPAIGRITPSGEITEFPGLRPHEFPIIYGPTPGSEGNLWFAGNARTSPAVERITPTGTIERFSAGLSRRTEYVGPFAAGADGNTWFRVEKRSRSDAGASAIGRITPGGQITEFSRCLRPMPEFAGPNFLTLGPDHDVWFTTWPSGDTAHPTRASTPSIGRIAPNGEITEFRLGLHPSSQPEDLVSAGGRLWFIDRETGAIGRIAPPRKPPNTFLVLGARRPTRGRPGAGLRVALPGPGRLAVHGSRVLTTRETVSACGTASIPVIPTPRLDEALLRHGGSRRVSVRLTFTPRGGSPFSQRAKVALRAG